MTVKRKIIAIDEDRCDGCGNCVIACAEGAIAIIDGKATVIADKFCDGLGACLGECPRDALHIVEREADEFDEAAVEAHLEQQRTEGSAGDIRSAAGCPSSQARQFDRTGDAHRASGSQESELLHWPVQIRLIPPDAPYLRGAHLLVAADCTPVAYPRFHEDFLKGKAVMVGCPKFDEGQAYRDKFTELFKQADIRAITVLIMEVPCCRGLPFLVNEAMEQAGKAIPMEVAVISADGSLVERKPGAPAGEGGMC